MMVWIQSSGILRWLWHATWEGSVLALLVLLAQALLRRKLSPQWSFALWWLVMLRLVLPASIPAPWSAFRLFPARLERLNGLAVPAERAPEIKRKPPAQLSEPGTLTVPEPGFHASPVGSAAAVSTWRWVYEAVGWLWLLGAAALAVRLWVADRRLKRLLADGREVRDDQLAELMKECAGLMGVRRPPVVLLTHRVDSPALVGCWRPRLVLPESLRNALSRAELRHVFLHELAHIRRGDLALNWLLCWLEALHWFNPILRYAFRRIQADREVACDALALSRMQPTESRSYGQTVLKILENLTRPAALPWLVGLLEEKQQMKRRIEMIARNPSRKNPALAAALFATLGMLTLTDAQTADPANSSPEPPAPSQLRIESGTAATPELLKQEQKVDIQHLRRIYKAIQAYYKDHKDLPNWLSDLVPQYLRDAGDLLSPIEKRTGKSVLFGREDPKIHTSYIYEFNAGPAPEEFNKGRAVPLTCKEWKLMQLEKFGMVTPILRSHIDQPVLNVAYSGQIYETGLLWENDPNTAVLIRKDPRLGPQQGEIPGPHLTIHVVDSATGAALPEACVRDGIGSEFGLLPPAQAKTDANGDVAVPLGDWKVNFLFVNANHPGYYPAGSEWNRETSQQDSPPAEMTLKLIPKPAN